MTVNIDQLRGRVKRSDAIGFLIAQLSGLGFSATSWPLSSNQHKFVRAFSTCWSDISETVRQIADFTVNDYATGSPLTNLSRSHFGNIQHPAGRTVGPYLLTNAGAVPYTIVPGQLILESTTGVQFTNTTGGTLAASGGTLTVTINAATAGSAGNVANDSITKMLTSLAGVTGTNSGLAGAPWYTTAGTDEESVQATRQRNADRITTLNQISMPGSGYRLIAMSVPGIERVEVDDTNPRGPNTLDVYVATAAGPAGATDLALVQAAFATKRSPSANVLAKAPTNRSLDAVGTVYFARGFNTASRQAQVVQQMTDYVNSLPIGGIKLPPATSGVFPKSELVTAMSQIPGVAAVNLTWPNVELTPMTALELMVVGVPNLTWLEAA